VTDHYQNGGCSIAGCHPPAAKPFIWTGEHKVIASAVIGFVLFMAAVVVSIGMREAECRERGGDRIVRDLGCISVDGDGTVRHR